MYSKKRLSAVAFLSMILASSPVWSSEPCYPLKVENWQEGCFLHLERDSAVDRFLMEFGSQSNSSSSSNWFFEDQDEIFMNHSEKTFSLLRPEFRSDVESKKS